LSESTIAIGYESGDVFIWDINSFKPISSIKCFNDPGTPYRPCLIHSTRN
jgi:WD40 repeat protein